MEFFFAKPKFLRVFLARFMRVLCDLHDKQPVKKVPLGIRNVFIACAI